MTIDGGTDSSGRVEPTRTGMSVEQSADLQSSRVPPVDRDPVPELGPVPELDPVPDLDRVPGLDPVPDLDRVPGLDPVPDLDRVPDVEPLPAPQHVTVPEPAPSRDRAPEPTAPADPYGQGPLVSGASEGPLVRADTLHDKALTAASDPDRVQIAVDVVNVALEAARVDGVQIPADQAAPPVAYLATRLQAHLDRDDPSPIS